MQIFSTYVYFWTYPCYVSLCKGNKFDNRENFVNETDATLKNSRKYNVIKYRRM